MRNSAKSLLLCACASIALMGCGKKDAESASEGAMSKIESTANWGGSPLDKPFKMSGGEALDVNGFLSSMGAEGALLFDTEEFDGKLGATVLTNVRMAGEQSPFTIGKVELYGVDTDVIAQLQGEGPMAEMGDVFRKIRMYDFEASVPMDAGSGKFSFEAIDLDSLSIKKPGEDGDLTEGQEFAMAAKSVSMGGIAVKGLSMDVANVEGLGAFTMMADDLQMGKYSAGKFGGMKMGGVEFNMVQDDETIAQAAAAMGPAAGPILNSPLKNILFPTQQSGTMDTFTWDGLSFAGLLGYLESGEKPPLSAKDLLSVGGISATNMVSMINGKTVSTSKKLTMSPIEFEHFMPKSIRMATEGDTYDLTAYVGDDQPEIQALLKDNGLDKITGSSKVSYDYSSKNKTISLATVGKAKGFSNSTFDLDIGNFDYEALMSGEEGAEAAAMGITVDGMTLKIDDEKLVDTGFAIAGQVMGQDPAQLRQQAVGLISLGSLQGAAISPRVPTYATALSTFISEGGSLEIKIDPEAPASFGALAAAGQENPGGVLDTLNLTVTQSK